MEVHLSPELEAKLKQVVQETGRAVDDLVGDGMAGYLEELSQVRVTLNSRYDDIESGRVKSVDGDEFFDGLRRKSQERRGARSSYPARRHKQRGGNGETITSSLCWTGFQPARGASKKHLK